MDTLNLNDSGDGMTPISLPVSQKAPEKNVEKQQITMDSTPIAEIMDDVQDPRMMMAPPQQNQQYMPAPPPPPPPAKQNPFNLTNEQFNALVAGICAVIAFSKPVQDKLLGMVPQFMENGSSTTMGVVASGLLVALLFYFGQKFVLNR
jgi:hypothetical protein